MNTILSKHSPHAGRRSLLAVALLFCLSVLSASAQSVTVNHIKYNITNSTQTAAVTGTDDKYIQNVVIADSVAYNGRNFPVVAVNSKAFQDYTNIRSVTFGSNIKKIGTYAFSGCQFLSEIIVPEGVETIENYAFQNCAMRYADLPSSLRTLGSGAFKSNAQQELDTLVLRTAYYDAAGQMTILPFSTSCFNSKTRLKNSVLMVPKKAYDYYAAATTVTGATNWGGFFATIGAFGTAPSGCTVVPQDSLKDYRDLSNVEVTFNFDDEKLQDVLSFGTGDYINAALVLPTGQRLGADKVTFKGNSICLDFAAVLQKNRELFIAPTEDATAIDVKLELEGQIQLEECPYMLGSFFAHHPINWNVPLLPSVYDLPTAPAVEPGGEATDGLYECKAFEAVTLTFDGYTALSLDSNTGAYLNARLLKDDGTVLGISRTAVINGDNTMTIPFSIPVDELRVRRSSGIESYGFMLEGDGQVAMKDGNDEKNFRFTLPFGTDPLRWQVAAVYIPEPTGASFLPAAEVVDLADLTDVAMRFEGVNNVVLDAAAERSAFSAQLLMDGCEMFTVGADRMRTEGNVLHIAFDRVDPRFITAIGNDEGRLHHFSVNLVADLLTDGYPCRMVVGKPALAPNGEAVSDSTSVGTAAPVPYTLTWTAPQWSVPAIVWPVPTYTVSAPQTAGNGPYDYSQLGVIEIEIDNYDSVVAMPVGDYANSPAVVARLLRGGRTVCMVNSVKFDGSKIIVDFGDDLTYHAAGITPDDDPQQPVVLTFAFDGDLLFDGIPYHLVIDGDTAGARWEINPIVVRKLPEPKVDFEDGKLSFSSATGGVTYHYSINNADNLGEQKATGEKTADGGSTLTLPLQREYIITVYSTRENYEDSEPTTVKLRLAGEPTIVEK